MYTEFFFGGGEWGDFFFLHTVLFLLSDVEHSCLSCSLDLLESRVILIQLKSNLLTCVQLLEGGGGGIPGLPTPPPLYIPGHMTYLH